MFDVFHKLPVSHDLDDGKIRSRDVIVDTQVKFSSLLLEPQIHDGLAKCGYIYLSPIQQNALPLVLTGSSIIAHAKSGTGKTLIYVLPILNDFVKRKLNGLRCLVLAPTREIAKQIFDVFQNVACYVKGLQIEYFIGGTPLDMDVIKCMNCHLAIGAPGRIKHLIDLGYLKTANLEFLVLDEVDALFDHKEYAVEDIISTLPPSKQLIVCTATLSSEVGNLVKSVVPSVKYTSANTLEIEEISNISNMLIAVKQYVAPVKKDSSSMDAMRKREKLVEILKKFSFEQCFIFVNYMTLVRSICNHLISQNFSALWISSDQNQSSRINTINKLKMNHCKILVTTDLAARGIDVHKVNLVINLGPPCPPEIYIHRMGRAGRYGSEGAVITILGEGEEMTMFTKMISVISTDPVDLHVLPEEIDATSNLEIIQCLPAEGSISTDEFSFKRQMKDSQERTAVKTQKDKKTKKKKRKGVSRLALQNGTTDQLSSANKNPKMANHEDYAVSNEITNERIEQFRQSLADFLVADESTPEWDSLRYLFSLDDCTTDESFSFVPNPPANLLKYALHVKQRNEFIDNQIVPCSVDEFLSLLNGTNSTFGRHSALCSLIKEIFGKIERPARQLGRSVTSDGSSFDSELSEISSQVSGVGIANLSRQLLETMINDSDDESISGRTVKKNAYSWSKKFSGNLYLAEEFSNAMMNYGKEYSSSLKPPTSVDSFKSLPKSDFQNTEKFEKTSPKQFSQNGRSNSDVENRCPKETDSESKGICNGIERNRSVNGFQDSGAANVCSGNTLEEHKTSPNQLSSHPNPSPSEGETQVHENVNESEIRKDEAKCNLDLSGQFFQAVENNYNSISTDGQLPSTKRETHKAKLISKDFNFADEFSNAICPAIEADFQNPLRETKSPPQPPSNVNHSKRFSNGTQSKISEKRVSTNWSSDQFSAAIDYREGSRSRSTFNRECQTKINVLEESENSVNADGLVHNLSSKTNALVKAVPKSADQEILAVRITENMSKPATENCALSDQFLSACKSKTRPKRTSNMLDTSNQRSATVNHSSGSIIPARIPTNEVSGRSSNLVSELKSRSNGISVPHHEETLKSNLLKPESSLKSILVPESERESNISTLLMNACSSSTKNPNSLSENEANKESSLVSNVNQNLNLNSVATDLKSNPVEFANYRFECVTESDVKTFALNKSENQMARRFPSDSRVVRAETCAGNVTKSSFPNVRQSENVQPGCNAVLIPSNAPGSKAVGREETAYLNFCGDQTSVTLPSLRSHVSGQQEQNIWRHHFAFIRRHAVSKGRVTANK